MKELKRLPKGIQTFSEIREEDYIYVDKTDMIYKLVKEEKYAFLSRPRRFGKSLLVSTLEAYFEGRKDLFKGLKITSLEKEWKKYPVIHFDLSNKEYDTKDSLTIALDIELEKYEDIYVDDEIRANTSTRFDKLIRSVYEKTGEKVVILVDEYDVPLLECPEELFEDYRHTYSAFFKNIKSFDKYIRFAFFTGVTKIPKLSIFSTLNNFSDISLSKEYSSLCGITEEELLDNFKPYIENLANEYDLEIDDCVLKLKEMYDGYFFSKRLIGVYNPYSIINCFSKLEFEEYWFESGTPSFLIKELLRRAYNLAALSSGISIVSNKLLSYDKKDYNVISLLYQAGYLTIHSYEESDNSYTLKYPNNEVEKGFIELAQSIVLNQDYFVAREILGAISKALSEGGVESLICSLKTLFSGVPYPNKEITEDVFRNYIYLVFKAIGLDVTCEGYTNRGRTDVIVTNKDYIYIIELKVDKTAEEALKQINDKGYAEKWALDERKIIKLGINYSNNDNNIDSFLIEV